MVAGAVIYLLRQQNSTWVDLSSKVSHFCYQRTASQTCEDDHVLSERCIGFNIQKQDKAPCVGLRLEKSRHI
jgi:hypothetical protein